jgi:hypothetical protein
LPVSTHALIATASGYFDIVNHIVPFCYSYLTTNYLHILCTGQGQPRSYLLDKEATVASLGQERATLLLAVWIERSSQDLVEMLTENVVVNGETNCALPIMNDFIERLKTNRILLQILWDADRAMEDFPRRSAPSAKVLGK